MFYLYETIRFLVCVDTKSLRGGLWLAICSSRTSSLHWCKRSLNRGSMPSASCIRVGDLAGNRALREMRCEPANCPPAKRLRQYVAPQYMFNPTHVNGLALAGRATCTGRSMRKRPSGFWISWENGTRHTNPHIHRNGRCSLFPLRCWIA